MDNDPDIDEYSSDQSVESFGAINCYDKDFVICLPSKEDAPPCHIENNGTFNLLSALESVYPLSDIVCQYLNYADLNNIGTISDAWLRSTEKEKLHRKQPSWSELDLDSCIISSANLKYAEKNQRIVFCDTYIALTEYVDVVTTETDEKGGNAESDNKQYLDHLNTDVPELAEAPISIRKTYITVPKVNSTCATSRENVLYLSLYLPDIPHIKVRNFWFKSKIPKRNANQLSKVVDHGDSIECLLLFNRSDANRTTSGLLKNLLQLQSRVVFGGGIVEAVNGFAGGTKVASKSDLFCIAFMRNRNDEEANFYSASFVLTEDDDFQERIQHLKETLEMRENTLIFRFCCFAKENKETENDSLKQTFPNAVVVGMDVNGEIGINSDMDYKKQSINHGYSTILVYICWGKLLGSKKSE